jgi:hypothetical protein
MLMNEWVSVSCAVAVCFSVAGAISMIFLRQTIQQNQEKHFQQMLSVLSDIQKQIEYVKIQLQEQEHSAGPGVRVETPSQAEEALRVKLTELLKISN